MVVASGFSDDSDSDPVRKFLDILVARGIITPEQREQALAVHCNTTGDIGQNVIDLGFAEETYVGMAKAKMFRLQWFDFKKLKVDPDAVRLIPESLIKRFRVLPVLHKGDKLFIAISDPKEAQQALDEIRKHLASLGIAPQPVLALKSDLDAAIEKHLSGQGFDRRTQVHSESAWERVNLDAVKNQPAANPTAPINLTGATKVVAVWGHPVAHSRSPKMQNAALAALGLDWVYVPFDVAPEQLEEAVGSLRALGFIGANCTVPLKELVGQYIDEIDPDALSAGSVNTIVNRDGRLIGYSTDGPGLIWDLERRGVELSAGMEVLIWGAGGSGRAIAHAFVKHGCRVTIANRTEERAVALAQILGSGAKGVALSGSDYEASLAKSKLLINTTTLGMHGVGIPPIPDGTLCEGQAVYDIVYSPPVTPLLEKARSCGCRIALNGLGMLACQGALSLMIWTGLDRSVVPVGIMLDAIDAQ
jgi:shikimate dehydrogenase